MLSHGPHVTVEATCVETNGGVVWCCCPVAPDSLLSQSFSIVGCLAQQIAMCCCPISARSSAVQAQLNRRVLYSTVSIQGTHVCPSGAC